MDEGPPQDWHEPFRDWCTAMEQCNKGLAILSNLLHDAQQERLQEGVLRNFLEHVAEEWEDTQVLLPSDDPELRFGKALEVFQRTVEDDEYLCSGNKAGERPQPNGCRRCRAAAPKSEDANPKKFSRVMNAEDFVAWHLDGPDLDIDDDRSMREALNSYEEWGLQDATKESYMRGELPVVWVTRTDDLVQLEERTEESCCADTVRECLGLFHLQKGHAVEIKYTEDKLTGEKGKKLELHVPTFLEGFRSPAFRSKTGYDGWGCTFNLRTRVCGFPEAVHKMIKFTDDFKLKYLGYLSDLGPTAEREEEFLEELLPECPRQWVPRSGYDEDLL